MCEKKFVREFLGEHWALIHAKSETMAPVSDHVWKEVIYTCPCGIQYGGFGNLWNHVTKLDFFTHYHDSLMGVQKESG